MKIIIVNSDTGCTRSLTLGGWTRALVSVCLLGIPAAMGAWGYGWLTNVDKKDTINSEASSTWGANLIAQRDKLEKSRQQAEKQVTALTVKLADLQARLVRLDAVGERLTKLTKLDKGEFKFSQSPGFGGPEHLGDADDAKTNASEFYGALAELSQQIQNREAQFKALDSILVTRNFDAQAVFDRLPVDNGFMSSTFGLRTDPFNGKPEFHSGIDFTAPPGTPIMAAAVGVVTLSTETVGYGNIVQVSHGGGLETRYAHCQVNLVRVGDLVKKGQVIALVGSTGRSTAPHVHFEVYKNGRVVDPSTYIHITNR